MTETDVLRELTEAGAVLDGHFELTSGRHSNTYVQCARVLEDPELTSRLAHALGARVEDVDIDVVAAPALGGVVIGFAMAQALGARFIFAEREDGVMTFRRGFRVDPGTRVLVVEDVVTTGGSAKEVAGLVRRAGGVVVGTATLIDRGGGAGLEGPHWSLLPVDAATWEPAECPLCASGEPAVKPGSRALGE